MDPHFLATLVFYFGCFLSFTFPFVPFSRLGTDTMSRWENDVGFSVLPAETLVPDGAGDGSTPPLPPLSVLSASPHFNSYFFETLNHQVIKPHPTQNSICNASNLFACTIQFFFL